MIIYTGGTFDLFHVGHLNFLTQCNKIAGKDGKIIVSLNEDDFIEKFKGNPPVMSYDERRRIIKAIPGITKVIPNKYGSDSKRTIEEMASETEMIVIGSDWARKNYYKQMNFTQNWLDKKNISLCYVPYYKGISTTIIKKEFDILLRNSSSGHYNHFKSFNSSIITSFIDFTLLSYE